ncbi:MAG TPA: heavy-metal-associated domain-containing protein [Pseudomonadota bacterium]|jgi:copper chaperone|nr:heavy-metal-associated domain-containing protein [Pseudomonadota bacterium]
MQFEVDNMSCGHCARTITKALQRLDPAAKVDVDLATKRVVATGTFGAEAAIAAMAAEDYPARLVGRAP